MAEVNLSKALKSKNRQVRLVNDLKKRIQEHNSVVEGTRRPFDIEKTYQELKSAVDKLVEIKAAINAANGPIQQHIYRMAELRGLAQFLRNMHVQEGAVYQYGMTAPAKVSQPEPGVLRLTIHEGRNRQVRRMCEAVGRPVQRLVRVRIGPLRDATLQPGEWRELAPGELKALAETVAGAPRRIR